jgi:hypothetical protein
MSYEQAMKWNRKHPKGTRQPIIMSTGTPWPVSRCATCGELLRDCECPYQSQFFAKLGTFEELGGILK